MTALSGCTTLRLGGPARGMVVAASRDELIAAVCEADRGGEPLLVLGGGSNLVIADEGFGGTVVLVRGEGVVAADADAGPDGHVRVTVQAGEPWDRLVEWTVGEKLAGLECLSGIPGLTGATPIQNVGAYGQEVAATIASVTVLDRATFQVTSLAGADCGFGYRTSVFKRTGWPVPAAGQTTVVPGPTGRHVVLDVTFALRRDPMSVPVRYAELAARLGVPAGGQAPLADVREAVLQLRRGKGMVLDPADPDTVSAGSFFTNPVLSRARFADLERLAAARGLPAVPVFPAEAGAVKVPAAWLIEQSGFGKGYPGRGPARISSKHTLALTNHDAASTADLLALAREIVAGVRSAFGIELANEPVLIGVTL